MAHIGTLRDYKFKGDVDDIRGADLYGRGGEKLGTVDDVVFDHAGGFIQYLVVDTGGWLKSNKFLVPADRVNARDGGRDFTCNISREQIETFPEYKDSIIRDEKDWDNYERRYRAQFDDAGGVLHREGSDHLITPDASELPPVSGDTGGADFTPQRLVNKFEGAEPRAEKTRLRPAGTAARAEDTSKPGNALTNESAVWSEEHTNRNRRATDRVRETSAMESAGESCASGIAGEMESSGTGSAYGNLAEQRVPEVMRNDPPAYRSSQEFNSQIGDRYSTNRRLADFENTLRQNRVDITSSCRACDVEKEDKDKAA